jgi:glycosyltransferase involved in cell wall biosynthesis
LRAGIDSNQWKRNDEKRKVIRDLLKFGPDVPVIAIVARLEVDKGSWTAVKVIDKLFQSGLKFGVIVLGDGSQRQAMQEFALKQRFLSRVFFAGFVDRERSIDYLSACDIFFLPSKLEGYGILS